MTPNAVIWEQPIDPQDQVDYSVNCAPLLEVGEQITSFSLNLPAESVLFGLQLGTVARLASRSGSVITMWLSFSGIPVTTPIILPIEVTITTNSVPTRTKQRTVAVKVDQL